MDLPKHRMEDTQPIRTISLARESSTRQRPWKGTTPMGVNSFSVLYAWKKRTATRQLVETLLKPWPISWVIGLTTICTCVLLLASSSLAYAVLLSMDVQH